MPQFDPTTFSPQIIWLIITFGILYLVMARSALPKVGNILQEREIRIAEDLEQAEKLREESRAVEAAYEKALADARAEAGKVLNDARAEITADIDAQKAALDARLAEKTGAAQAEIKAAIETALKELETVAQDACAAIVVKLIGNKADGKKVAAAVHNATENANAGNG